MTTPARQPVCEPSRQPTRFRVDGDMTIYHAVELKARIIDAVRDHAQLELDLAAVTDLDTAGLQLLVLGRREATRLGHGFDIVACSERVRRLLHTFNVAELSCRPCLTAETELPAGQELCHG